jgi:GntR family transcriptional repressor for pyruvate dehydrogenase complex
MPAVPRVPAELFHRVQTPRTFEDVVGQIVEGIRSGVLQEGDVLPGERVLAERMEVSRPTVRAAIGQLADAGVITTEPGRAGGARITSMWIPERLQLRPWDVAQADEVLRLLEARRALEPHVAQLAALRGRDEHFGRMRESIDLQRRHEDDRHKALQAEELFHRIMWRAADNATLERMLVDAFARLEPVRDLIMRDQAHMSIALELHERTLSALMRGGGEEIEAAMDAHLRYTEDLAEDVLGRRMRMPSVLLPGGEHGSPPGAGSG